MTAPRRPLTCTVVALAALAVLGCAEAPESPTPAPAPAARPSPAVTVTPSAAGEVRWIAAEHGRGDGWFVRLRVVPGGCQGFMHKLDIDDTALPGDCAGESNGVRVVADESQLEMLRGTRVDYVEEGGKRGFKVEAPNFQGESAAKWLAILRGGDAGGGDDE